MEAIKETFERSKEGEESDDEGEEEEPERGEESAPARTEARAVDGIVGNPVNGIPQYASKPAVPQVGVNKLARPVDTGTAVYHRTPSDDVRVGSVPLLPLQETCSVAVRRLAAPMTAPNPVVLRTGLRVTSTVALARAGSTMLSTSSLTGLGSVPAVSPVPPASASSD